MSHLPPPPARSGRRAGLNRGLAVKVLAVTAALVTVGGAAVAASDAGRRGTVGPLPLVVGTPRPLRTPAPAPSTSALSTSRTRAADVPSADVPSAAVPSAGVPSADGRPATRLTTPSTRLRTGPTRPPVPLCAPGRIAGAACTTSGSHLCGPGPLRAVVRSQGIVPKVMCPLARVGGPAPAR